MREAFDDALRALIARYRDIPLPDLIAEIERQLETLKENDKETG